ncbi:MAG: hypothetical protein MRJ93_01255 [Nitrososphaeraceae archaeon]|nr:hypothetical protein [Nitrososphaeraceae archaeon]
MNKNNRDLERKEELKEECNKLLTLNDKIRYAGILNEFGRTLVGKMKSGLVPLLSHTEARNEFFIHSMIFNLRKNYQNSIGQTEFILFQSEKVNIISFIKNQLIYYLTIERSIPSQELNEIINSITEKLRHSADS